MAVYVATLMPLYLGDLHSYLRALKSRRGRRMTMVEARLLLHQIVKAARSCHLAGVIHQ